MTDWDDDPIGINKRVVINEVDGWLENCSEFTLIHINIRSINKHWNELNATLSDHIGKFHVLALTEVGVRCKDEISTYYNIDGYELIYNVRNGKRGGGIFLYVLNKIRVTSIISSFTFFEGIDCELTLENNTKIKLLTIYRPPDLSRTSFLSELENIIVNTKHKNAIILGDTNLDTMSKKETSIIQLENIIAVNGFYKCIVGATREEIRDGKLSVSCIDHIFVRSNAKSINSAIATLKITDHYMVMVDINFSSSESKGQFNNSDGNGKECTKFREKSLHNQLKTFDWQSLMGVDGVNDTDELYQDILKVFNKFYLACCYSSKLGGNRNKKKWLTTETKNKMKQRDSMFRKWKDCKNNLRLFYESEYKKLRAEVQKESDRDMANFFKDKFERDRGDLAKTWQNISMVLGKKKRQTVDEVLNSYLRKQFSSKDIANNFSKTFIDEVSRTMHHCNIVTSEKVECQDQLQSMYMPHVTAKDIMDIISKMDVNKPPGCDGVRVRDLKTLSLQISPLLVKVVNNTLDTAKIPETLKMSIIKPVYKKGDHMCFSNYRPIALLPVIEKITERCIANKLNDYLTKFNIINENQYGFQKGKSTTDLLMTFSDYVNMNLNDNFHVLALFIDFSKAFDTINHHKLLVALEKIGVRGPLLMWFKDYLHNRSLKVQVNDHLSEKVQINSGVPQGSILGPVLYLIYVNEMFGCVTKCRMFMYADDTVVVVAHRNIVSAANILQHEFTNVLKWTHDHDLICNPNKTKVMHLCSPLNRQRFDCIKVLSHSYDCLHNNSQNFCKCTESIENVDDHIYLGIKIDRFFTWKPHIHEVCSRLRSVAFCMYKIRPCVPTPLLRTIYFALAESIMSYGILAWGNASKSHMQQISNIQNKLIKNISAKPENKMLTINQLYRNLNILPVSANYAYKLIIKFFFNNDFKILQPNQLMSARLRNRDRYITPTFVNKHGKRTFKYIIPVLFNDLPPEIASLEKYKIAKDEVRKWILTNLSDV
jgi:hypothetical protein